MMICLLRKHDFKIDQKKLRLKKNSVILRYNVKEILHILFIILCAIIEYVKYYRECHIIVFKILF